jgi:hypothetical protein
MISIVDICFDDESDEDNGLLELGILFVVLVSTSVTSAALRSDND